MKKVLIITYYWPPAGGPGVQRWLKFVKYLPDYGIDPIVYIPENPTYPIVDIGLLDELPPNVTILKKKIVEPYTWAAVFSKKNAKSISSGIIPNQKKQTFLQKTMLWVRGNLFIPDARVLWVKPSVHFLSKYIQENNIDTIITSGPPHSLHLIGFALKEKLGIKWLADFRDPWTTIGYHKALKLGRYASKKHDRMELQILNAADTVIVTSPTTKKEFERITAKPIVVITNGYDVEKKGKVILDEKFTLAHIGSFLSDRNPKILWEALRELVEEIPEFKRDFELKLLGKVSQEVLDTVSYYRLDDYLNNLGYVSHQKAIEAQRNSQVLLLIEIDSDETKSIIPGKLFEYMVSERPIIGIGPKDSDFATILKETNTGFFCTYLEKEKLKKQISLYYNEFLAQNLKVYPVGLQQYSRKSLTAVLAVLLHK
jgi:glycosyltransferase involved in cell wall biosynthesis